jgi:hypothetical protein
MGLISFFNFRIPRRSPSILVKVSPSWSRDANASPNDLNRRRRQVNRERRIWKKGGLKVWYKPSCQQQQRNRVFSWLTGSYRVNLSLSFFKADLELVWLCGWTCVWPNFKFFFFTKIECDLYFLDRFDVLMSKMILKKWKNIIGMYFGTKSYLKNNHYHTAKHALKPRVILNPDHRSPAELSWILKY